MTCVSIKHTFWLVAIVAALKIAEIQGRPLFRPWKNTDDYFPAIFCAVFARFLPNSYASLVSSSPTGFEPSPEIYVGP